MLHRLALVAASFVACMPVNAIVRRHDVTDQQVLDLAANNFKGVGLLTFSNNPSDKRTVTLISDRFILTAGHNMPSGTNTASVLINGQTYNTSNWIRHPNYSSSNVTNGYDLAVAKLDRRVTNTKPFALYSGVGEIGMVGYLVGYGGTGTGLTGANSYPWTLRAGTNKLEFDSTLPNMLVSDFDSGNASDNSSVWPGSTATMTDFEACLAPGDSGGPVLAQFSGVYKVVGLCEARAATDGTTNSDYGDISIFTRTGSLTSWIKDKAWENGRVNGKVALADFVGNVEGVSASIEIRDSVTSVVAETVSVPLACDGGFSFVTNLRGTYDIAVKTPHWLRTVWQDLAISNNGPADLETIHVNGDVDNDNEVGPGDFSDLTTAFGSVEGDANWSWAADLDGDGEVGPSDFSVLTSGFGSVGAD